MKIKPFCTYITYYSGTKLPPYYIGHSSVEKVKSGYHGSVSSKEYKKIYLKELIDNPELFKTEIIETFKTKREAEHAEGIEQRKVNAANNPLYMNKNNHLSAIILEQTEKTRTKLTKEQQSKNKRIIEKVKKLEDREHKTQLQIENIVVKPKWERNKKKEKFLENSKYIPKSVINYEKI